MKSKLIIATLALAVLSNGANAGCLGGAVVGGVAGHMAHHHAIAGAAVGCVVGHEMAVHKKKKLAAQRHAAALAAQHPGAMAPAPAH